MYPGVHAPSARQIKRLISKFENNGTVRDRRSENTGRPVSTRSHETIEEVGKFVEDTPRISIRSVMRELTNTNKMASYGSVRRMLKYDLKLTPYKISVMQHLKDKDVTARLAFAQRLGQTDEIIDNIWFTDECHFYLNGCVNKQNLRVWSSEKPEFYDERALHSDKVTVWAALSTHGIIGPFFYEEQNETVTVTSERYLKIINGKFIPALRRRGYFDSAWLQQDGAILHTANCVLDSLLLKFGDRVISLKRRFSGPRTPQI